MPRYAYYDSEGDEHLQFAPPTDVAVGEPVQIALDYWGVTPLGVLAQQTGDFRVSGRFRCLKTTPSDSFSIGDFLAYTPGSGFAIGDSSWRAMADSPSGQTYVIAKINEGGAGGSIGSVPVEVVRQSGILSGVTPIDAKLGLNEDTGQVFYRDAVGEWDQVAGSSRVLSGKLSSTNVSSNGIDVPGLPATPSVLAMIIISTQWDAAELTINTNRVSWSGTTLQTDNRLATGDPYTIIWEP